MNLPIADPPLSVESFKRRFRLRYNEARILEMLSEGHEWTTYALALFLCRGRPSNESIRVQVCHLRKKIQPIEISTTEHGYRIDEPHLTTLRGCA